MRRRGRAGANQQRQKLGFTLSRAAQINALPFTPLSHGERNVWRSDGLGSTVPKVNAAAGSVGGAAAAAAGVAAAAAAAAVVGTTSIRPGTVMVHQRSKGQQDRPESSLGGGGGRKVVLPGLGPGRRGGVRCSFGGAVIAENATSGNGLAALQERLDSAGTSESERQQIGADGQLLVPICPVLYLVRDPKYAPSDYANLPRRIVLNKSQLVLGRGRQSDVVFDSRSRPSLVSKSESS